MKDSVIPKIYRIFQLSPAKLDSECFHESQWTAMREPFLMTCWFDKLNLQKGNKDFWASTCNAAWLLYPFHQWWWSCDCGGPFWENGSVSTPVIVLSLFVVCILFVEPINRILDSTGASWLRKMWLLLLKDNAKGVKRRREFISNVCYSGGRPVRVGQVVSWWRCNFMLFHG